MSQYGIFETTNGWLTQAVVIEPHHRVMVTAIQLNVRLSERQLAKDKVEPDVLIGQMVSSAHSLACTDSTVVLSGITTNMNVD